MTLRLPKTAFLFAGLACGVAWTTSSAAAQSCAVGVNVNSFQNFSADEQMAIVDQLKQNGVGSVRTSLRPDDKSMILAKALQSAGIGLVLNTGWKTDANAPERPEYPKPHIRAALPLSRIDLGLSKAYFQTVSTSSTLTASRSPGLKSATRSTGWTSTATFRRRVGERPSRSTSSPKIPSANKSPQELSQVPTAPRPPQGGARSFQAQRACAYRLRWHGHGFRRQMAGRQQARRRQHSGRLRLSSCARPR